MKIYSKNDNYILYQGNCLDMLDVLKENSIDSIVTDPPYELGFMGKSWDSSGVAFQKDTWEKCLKVLKPGGYLLAFGGTRTYHRIACAIEDAGFEIRDTIMWLYGSGFPKSMNIGLAIDKKNGVDSKVVAVGKSGAGETHTRTLQNKLLDGGYSFGGEYEIKEAQNEWKGWGTQLKPSYEPIIIARKPVENTIVDNVMKYGVGGINIDECRVSTDDYISTHSKSNKAATSKGIYGDYVGMETKQNESQKLGRFPSNTILSYDDIDFDEVCGGFPYTKSTGGSGEASKINTFKNVSIGARNNTGANLGGLGDEGSAARYFKNCPYTEEDFEDCRRYFYCAKASKRDRDEGLEEIEATTDKAKGNGLDRICEFCGVSQLTPELCHCETKSWITKPKKNIHPTVKPTELMRYLVRMVTPNGGTVLDPFNGSGSTGKATMFENTENNKNYKYVGIELTEEYLPIARARIEYAQNKKPDTQTKKVKKKVEKEKKGNKLF